MRSTNHQTQNNLVKGHHLYNRTWMSASYDWGTNQQEGGTIGTHRNPDCLSENTPTEHNKYFVNQKL